MIADDAFVRSEVAVADRHHRHFEQRIEQLRRARLMDRAEAAGNLEFRIEFAFGHLHGTRERRVRGGRPVDRQREQLEEIVIRIVRARVVALVVVVANEEAGRACGRRRRAVDRDRRQHLEAEAVEALHALALQRRGQAREHRVAIERVDRGTFVRADIIRIGPDAVFRIVGERRRVERVARPRRDDRIVTIAQVRAERVARARELGEKPAVRELVEYDDAVAEALRAWTTAAEAVHVERTRGEAAVARVVHAQDRAAAAVVDVYEIRAADVAGRVGRHDAGGIGCVEIHERRREAAAVGAVAEAALQLDEDVAPDDGIHRHGRMTLKLFFAVELARNLADRIAGPPVLHDRTRARIEENALGRRRRAHVIGAARNGRGCRCGSHRTDACREQAGDAKLQNEIHSGSPLAET